MNDKIYHKLKKLKGGTNMRKVIKELGLTQSQVDKILLARKKTKPKILKHHLSNNKFKVGLIADTHLCSKQEKLNELHTFYSICKKSGVKHVLHAGDIVDGQGIYHGHLSEIHTFGAQAQADYCVEMYPKVSGITTHFIVGNHDDVFWKSSGIDIGTLISRKRDDMLYYGQYQADVVFGKIKIRLMHPDGGGAYALSYKGQKLAEQIASGKKPHVLCLGHYHTNNYFYYRRMHILNLGTFQGQTDFLLRKGLMPAIGGWIVEMYLNETGNKIVAFNTSWIPF